MNRRKLLTEKTVPFSEVFSMHQQSERDLLVELANLKDSPSAIRKFRDKYQTWELHRETDETIIRLRDGLRGLWEECRHHSLRWDKQWEFAAYWQEFATVRGVPWKDQANRNSTMLISGRIWATAPRIRIETFPEQVARISRLFLAERPFRKVLHYTSASRFRICPNEHYFIAPRERSKYCDKCENYRHRENAKESARTRRSTRACVAAA